MHLLKLDISGCMLTLKIKSMSLKHNQLNDVTLFIWSDCWHLKFICKINATYECYLYFLYEQLIFKLSSVGHENIFNNMRPVLKICTLERVVPLPKPMNCFKTIMHG